MKIADDIEIWKPIAHFPKYEVSSWGRIKSYWGKEPKILKQIPDKNGYLRLTLIDENGKK